MTDPLLVRAARREPVERTPVWFMRQAGRSLPEYRAVRERFGLVENVGPVVSHPIETVADLERLHVTEPEENVPFVLEAIRLTRAELRDDQAVVGFCGGPFTVAGYLVEGRPSRESTKVKRMMYGDSATWHA